MALKKILPHPYMPRYGEDDPTYCDYSGCNSPRDAEIHFPNRIIIERRELVAEITPHPDGAVSMIEAAWQVAGKYVSENSGDLPVQVEFNYMGWKHTAGSEKVEF
jgi:hypothetical protein